MKVKIWGDSYSVALDESRVRSNQKRVLLRLLDGKWHPSTELMQVGGSEWGRRVRSLREGQFGGMRVDRRRRDNGVWEYKLAPESVDKEVIESVFIVSGTET